MLLKKLDFLSPRITLSYSKGYCHSSKVSGILTILYGLSVFAVFFYYSAVIIMRKKKTAYYFENYIDDPGKNYVNSKSLFHYMVLNNKVIFDERAINIIGIKSRPSSSLVSVDELNVDHWRYSSCDIHKDFSDEIKGKINSTKALCIQEYYNHKLKQKFSLEQDEFNYPVIEHGTRNNDFIPYLIIIQKCKNNSISDNCYSEEDITKYLSSLNSMIFTVVDQFVDIDNFKNPFFDYFNSVEIAISTSTINAISFQFNPIFVRTHDGLFFNQKKEFQKLSLDETVRSSYDFIGNSVLTIIPFWIHNRGKVYERFYTNFPDVIATISGISKIISTIFYFFNFIYNKYITLEDFEILLKERLYKKKLFEKKSPQGIVNSEASILTVKLNMKRDIDLINNFEKKKITFRRVVSTYFNISKVKYITMLIGLRKKIISEERLLKNHLFLKKVKIHLLQFSSPCLQEPTINNYLDGDTKKKNIGDLTSNEFINGSLMKGKNITFFGK